MQPKVPLNKKMARLMEKINHGTATAQEIARFKKMLQRVAEETQLTVDRIEESKRIPPETFNLVINI